MLDKNTFQKTKVKVIRVSKAFFWMLIPEWNPTKEICFPMADIPELLRSKVAEGVVLSVYANLAASKPSEMHLERFELHSSEELQ